MKFTRRNFVKFGGAAVFAALGFSDTIFAKTRNDSVLANQTAESFRQLIGTEFYIWCDDFSTSAKLGRIQDFPKQTKGGESFSMFFETSLKRAEQATYNVFHPSLGNFELLLTEGRSENRCLLVATVNRI